MATMATNADDKTDANRISRYGWYALTLVSCAQSMSLLDRQILSILATNIREDLGIGDAELGLLYGTVFALFYALFSLPLGRLVDGWVRTKLLAICLAVPDLPPLPVALRCLPSRALASGLAKAQRSLQPTRSSSTPSPRAAGALAWQGSAWALHWALACR